MKVLAVIGLLAILAVIAVAVFFFGGYYSVAATQADPAIVDWTLAQVRLKSVGRHAGPPPAISLDDAAVIRTGARAFAVRGCPICHGAPGVEWAKFSEAMRPDPPDLSEVVKARTPEQLFWVIKNGIKMTGMPGFALVQADDREIWTIVAFVRRLPNVSEADYKAWSAP